MSGDQAVLDSMAEVMRMPELGFADKWRQRYHRAVRQTGQPQDVLDRFLGRTRGFEAMGMDVPEGFSSWGKYVKATRTGLLEATGRGALSAILPIDIVGGKQKAFMKEAAKGLGGGTGMWAAVKGALPSGLRKAGGAVLGQATKWMGPLILAHRLKTETGGRGVLGGANKGVRIVGEEIAWAAGAGAGMALGSWVGGTLLGTLGSAAGPVGTVVGLGLGIALGAIGSATVNKVADMAETPFRLAHSGYKYFRDLGRKSRRLELGGGISAGNQTRLAATMRQRGLQQMSRSGINARSLLGREAGMMHLR